MNSIVWQPNKEGIFHGVPAEVYHKAPGVSNSMLKHMDPPACLPVYMRAERKETVDMLVGTLIHQMVLELDKPLPVLAIKPKDMSFATKEGKAWREEARAAKKTIIDEVDYQTVHGCVTSVLENPTCKEIFKVGAAEVSLFVHHQTGLLRKARLDWLPTSEEWNSSIVDIKSVQGGCASHEGFAKVCAKEGYHEQAAYYLKCWNDLNGDTDYRDTFLFIAVEKEAPLYLVGFHFLKLGSNELNSATRRREADLFTFDRCHKENNWPGYSLTPTQIKLPRWAMRNEIED